MSGSFPGDRGAWGGASVAVLGMLQARAPHILTVRGWRVGCAGEGTRQQRLLGCTLRAVKAVKDETGFPPDFKN